jgi:hypothetical protein
LLATTESWAAVVLGGQPAQNADDADAIRSYVIAQANAALAAPAQ